MQWPRLPTINMPGAAAVLVTLLAAAGPHLYISISLVQLQPSCRASLHSAHTTIQPAATFYLDAVKYLICYIGSRLICEYISFKIIRKNFHGQNKWSKYNYVSLYKCLSVAFAARCRCRPLFSLCTKPLITDKIQLQHESVTLLLRIVTICYNLP